ncbi:MAG: amino acid ABC transporter [Oligoflexia bacterium]|nr:amino acid ABC transporter [Oligoflexia bacterium]
MKVVITFIFSLFTLFALPILDSEGSDVSKSKEFKDSKSDKPFKFGYSDDENYPYQMGNGTIAVSPPGLAVELIDRAVKSLGLKVEFVRLPAARLLVDMEKNELDGTFIFSFKEERIKNGVYPMIDNKPNHNFRITSINYSFYKKEDSPIVWDGKVLSGCKSNVGINFSFSIGADLKKLGLSVDSDAKTTEQNIEKLIKNRICAYATLELTGDSYLKRNDVMGVIKMTPPITSKDYFLMFSHRFYSEHKNDAENIWKEIEKIRDSFIESSINKYQR